MHQQEQRAPCRSKYFAHFALAVEKWPDTMPVYLTSMAHETEPIAFGHCLGHFGWLFFHCESNCPILSEIIACRECVFNIET